MWEVDEVDEVDEVIEVWVERKGPAGNCLAIARRPREDIPVDRLLFCLQPFV